MYPFFENLVHITPGGVKWCETKLRRVPGTNWNNTGSKKHFFDKISIFCDLWPYLGIFSNKWPEIIWNDTNCYGMKLGQLLDTIWTNSSQIPSNLENFSFFWIFNHIWALPPGGFRGNWFWTFSLINIISMEVDGHN